MRRLTMLLGMTALTFAGSGQAFAAPWERGYAVDTYEPAFHFAGKAGTEDPGSDCPLGANPGYDIREVAKTPWRTQEDVEKLFIRATTVNGGSQAGAPPAGAAPARAAAPAPAPAAQAVPPGEGGAGPPGRPGGGRRNPLNASDLSARGFAPNINTYINPMAAIDEGILEVTGKVSEGFDLDGDPATGGFISPDGRPGIDNGLYRALGCTAILRAKPGMSMDAILSNDHMRDGLHTILIRLTGAQDPMNDSDVTVEIGYSPDDLVKDANSGAAPKYSYRLITNGPKYAKFKARIVGGRLQTESLEHISIPDWAFTEMQIVQPLSLFRARVQLDLQPEGALKGMIGGYAPWENFFVQSTWIGRQAAANVRENHFRANIVANYYALRRNADGMPDASGRMQGLSQAYRLTAVPAHVIVDPMMVYEEPPTDEGPKFERDTFRQVIKTGVIARGDPAPAAQQNAAADAPPPQSAPAAPTAEVAGARAPAS